VVFVNSIDEFEAVVNQIVGVYYDATIAFKKTLNWFEDKQKKGLEIVRKNKPELKGVNDLDFIPLMYGDRDPNDPEAKILHICTQGEYKNRNREHGLNYKFLGNMAIVAIYQYWEDAYRKK